MKNNRLWVIAKNSTCQQFVDSKTEATYTKNVKKAATFPSKRAAESQLERGEVAVALDSLKNKARHTAYFAFIPDSKKVAALIFKATSKNGNISQGKLRAYFQARGNEGNIEIFSKYSGKYIATIKV